MYQGDERRWRVKMIYKASKWWKVIKVDGEDEQEIRRMNYKWILTIDTTYPNSHLANTDRYLD